MLGVFPGALRNLFFETDIYSLEVIWLDAEYTIPNFESDSDPCSSPFSRWCSIVSYVRQTPLSASLESRLVSENNETSQRGDHKTNITPGFLSNNRSDRSDNKLYPVWKATFIKMTTILKRINSGVCDLRKKRTRKTSRSAADILLWKAGPIVIGGQETKTFLWLCHDTLCFFHRRSLHGGSELAPLNYYFNADN